MPSASAFNAREDGASRPALSSSPGRADGVATSLVGAASTRLAMPTCCSSSRTPSRPCLKSQPARCRLDAAWAQAGDRRPERLSYPRAAVVGVEQARGSSAAAPDTPNGRPAGARAAEARER